MIRWVIVLFVALALINWLQSLLHRIGLGRLPGDFHFRFLGRDWFFPLTSTIIFSALVSFLMRWL